MNSMWLMYSSILAIVILLIIYIIIYFKSEKYIPIEVKDVLLTREELINHGRELGRNHNISKNQDVKEFLLCNLDKNFKEIEKIYLKLSSELNKNTELPKASEWLLDNFYIVELQYKRIRQNLEGEKRLELNVLQEGRLKGYPRIYILALELVSHTEGIVTDDALISFVNSYQEENILSIQEISSLSLMLTLALMEYIKTVCLKIYKTGEEWKRADKIDISSLSNLDTNVNNTFNMDPSFLQRLYFRMRKNENDINIAILEKRLNYHGTSIKNIIEKEYDKQAAIKMAIGNCITSMKNISNLDWINIFESLCIVEKILCQDPLEIYEKMDLESKNYYRYHVQKFAYELNSQETFIAKKALELANEKYKEGIRDKQSHVGFYILDKGRSQIFESLGKKSLRKGLYLSSEKYYTIPIIFSTLIIVFLFSRYAYIRSNVGMAIVVGLITLVPVSCISISIFNIIFSKIFSPILLPKIDLKDGIPEDLKTFVVIPTLLPSQKRVEELAEQLEIHYLSNREKNLYFAILGDFKDAEEEKQDGDQGIIDTALKVIEELNKKYSKDENIFYYFNRNRIYSEVENRWMGWERKRGALVEFNDLILGSSDTSYSIISSDISRLQGKIKYIITLDADTKLPLETAKKLVGAIAHPLNEPVVDEEKKIVVEGYGIIQPRILVDVESSNKSLFTRIYAGQGGIDPYTTAISDIYQDLFGEGIFTGKGIYVLDIFQNCLKEAIPENTVLSHDLLEGSYIRTGLATDVELIDGYPEKYSSYIMRLHRWVRGDWQLIRWLKLTFSRPISKLSQWKIMDNLRRSIVPISLLFLTVLGLIVFPGNILCWLGLTLVTLFMPFIISLIEYILYSENKIDKLKLNGNLITGLKGSFYQGILSFLFLPYEGYMMLDAIIRTIYRMFFSKKNLLQWTTAFDMEKKLKNNAKSYFIRMKVNIIVGVAAIFIAFLGKSKNMYVFVILGGLWAVSPLIAYLISAEDREIKIQIDTSILKRISRKTWDYYETYANEDNNYLPPDNFQEFPYNGVAYRTSPTNIGFLLLTILSARDLGYITTSEMLYRLDKTIESIEKMEKWKGHLYNWYNTTNLKPLRPYFVSTVDSGNFVSYLYILKEGLKEYLEKPLVDKKLIDGMKDTIFLIEDENIKEDFINQIDKLDKLDINSLYNIYVKFNELSRDRKDKWIEKSLDRMNAILNESEAFFPKEELLYTIEYNYEKLNIYLSPIELKEYYKESLKSIKNEKCIEVISNFINNLESFISNVEKMMRKIDKLIEETEFSPLYDYKKDLFSIGYFVEEKKLLDSYYDLLASEARISSYIAICRGEVPKKHWFKLGRSLIVKDGYRCLASWTGTMFEYLMPTLVMKNYKNTLLDETYKTAIRFQRDYCKKKKIPWGISESGFFAFDVNLNYQYKAFGVPQLGFKRGLKEDLVVSPYSSMLALNFYTEDVSLNMSDLIEENMEGEYGFYEAIDYTKRRLPIDVDKAIVKSYMTHHQGMIFLSINNYLNNNILVDRFHRNPQIKCGEVLLQEKIPIRIIVAKEKENISDVEYREVQKETNIVRTYGKSCLEDLKCHILSSGNYFTFITSRGTGYSKKENIFLNRWRKDLYTRAYGYFIYIKDLTNGKYWSTTYEPTKIEPDKYEVKFSNDKVTFYRKDGEIETQMDVILLSEDDGEIRKVTLTNNKSEDILIEVLSYFELVGDSIESDLSHSVFNNLFIKTEVFHEYEGLIGHRRKKSEEQSPVWVVHSVKDESEGQGGFQYETNRVNFVGRGNDLKEPSGIYKDFTNTVGAVLDPIMSLKKRIKIKSGESVRVYFITGISESREKATMILKKYRDNLSLSRAFDLAYTRSQTEIGYLNYRQDEIKNYDELLPNLIFFNGTNKRRYENIISQNTKGQNGLWPYGISGDNPIILIRIKTMEGVDTLKEILKAHGYWSFKGLNIDLVILNEDESSYYQPLLENIKEVVYEYRGSMLDINGGIFIRSGNNMPYEDKVLLFKWATMIINAEEGFIKDKSWINNISYKEFKDKKIDFPSMEIPLELDYFNGYGGFSKDGKQYIIKLSENMNTPLPWINVIANRNFGFIVSERGTGFTYVHNSRENKLTPWYNDPIIDVPGEIIYLRDDEVGDIWNITPSPIREKEDYIVTHCQGYTKFYHYSHGIEQELNVYVPLNDNVKINLIKLKNNSNLERKLTVVYFVRPVLGVTDELTDKYIETFFNEKEQMVLAKNTTNTEFKNTTMFIATSEKIKSYTGDRMEFTGSLGSLTESEGLKREYFSNRVGIGYDPCCAIEVEVIIPSGGEKEIVMLLGESTNLDYVFQIGEKYKQINVCKDILETIKQYWNEKLGKITVETPDLSMNLMMNNWLLYQNVVSRLWARAAFYQVGGAYGARDQIQDAMNLVYTFPEECKMQILNVCKHQFVEGDVQHWWHPSPNRETHKGIRTKYSDDLLWLPYAVTEYIRVTGDYSILEEKVPFIESELLREEEQEKYEVPQLSKEIGSVYEHCIRAIDKALVFGERGLPLMGSGDWNDGMNKVGYKGKGESIWLAWFLGDVLVRFISLCKNVEDEERVKKYSDFIGYIKDSIEKNGWDGDWYLRAYFDDGTPLGSKENEECRIDSIAQSWGVLSSLGNEEKNRKAMESVEKYLVREEEGMILLLTPPFVDSPKDPGYIKSYVPGVRENGGQYTHAAAWVIGAFAMLGDGDKSYKLFNMINPINHARTFIECTKYKVEPYVIAADVYGIEPHVGRGGWTWYTGSAGWVYKVGLEYILGFKIEKDKLIINPCISKDWNKYSISYKYFSTTYNIEVKNPYKVNSGVNYVDLDGRIIEEKYIDLIDDGKEHFVKVVLGSYKEKLE